MPGEPQIAPVTGAAAAIAAVAELGDEAMSLLRPEAPPQSYVELLIQQELYADAVRFLAHALPKREAVWWAWVSARRSAGPEPPPKVAASLTATEQWIIQPNEENRRKAMAAAEEATFSTPAGCAGLGAFFSGGSIAPPGAPHNPPGEFLTAKAVAGSVTLSAVATEPEKAPEKYRASLTQALEVTRRIKLWG